MRRRTVVPVAVLGAAGLVYGIALALVWRAAREDQRRPAGAIVVLGAAQYNGKPSPVLKARLDHALELEEAGFAPLLVVTGGIGSGDRESEATVGRRYLVARGVPDSQVVVLPEGKNTDQTMAAVGDWVRDRGLIDVLLVSDAFHLARLRVEARRHGVTAYTSPAAGSPISGSREWGYFLAEGVKLPVAYLLP
ncbi:MAG TPA: YdcF family protein [Gemmatimonadales bacterium]|nr:YdcF family protein [Gemmatimonadales bacterium]